MGYVIDPRKNWAMPERLLADETDPRRRQILETLIAHSKAESTPDFAALMATVSPRAHYHAFASDDPTHSPQGKAGVEAYYKAIVESGCYFIEHAHDRIVVDRDAITTEGTLKMAYPGVILGAMGVEVPDPDALYVYEARLMIAWEFDEEGLVLCEDSYDGGGPKFEGIADRRVELDQIYRVGDA
jgi:hypothetical protein